MLEKGRYTKAADLSLKEREAMDTMYEAGSLMTTQDASAHTPGADLAICTLAVCHRTVEQLTQIWAVQCCFLLSFVIYDCWLIKHAC